MAAIFNNTNAIPGLIFIGALTVPLSGLFFFMNQMRLKILAFLKLLSCSLLAAYFHY